MIDWLGCGNEGQVYKVALESDPTVHYALKCEPARVVEPSEIRIFALMEEFFPEPALAGICRRLGTATVGGYLFTLQELAEGTSVLQAIQKRGQCSLGTVRGAAKSLLPTLTAMEGHGIMHNDVKPENIMIDINSNARLIDFGHSSQVGDPPRAHRVGTGWYRPPEVVFEMARRMGGDIWAMGCVFAEMYLGVPIFAARFHGHAVDELHLLRLMEIRRGRFSEQLISQSARRRQLFDRGKVRWPQNPGFDEDIVGERWSLGEMIRRRTDDEATDEEKGEFFDLLKRMLQFDPEKRIKAAQIADHPFIQRLA